MGLEYLTRKELESKKDSVTKALDQTSYFVRAGVVSRVLGEIVGTDKRILELGAGHGVLARQLLGLGYKKIDAVDIDDYLDADLSDKVTLTKSDISTDKLQYVDRSVDVVLAIAIFEHLENPFFAIREIARVLKPCGKLFVALPNAFSIRSRLLFLMRGEIFGYTRTNNHVALFSRAIFDKLFLKHFKIVETLYDPGYIKIFGKKIQLPRACFTCGQFFGNKVLYILERN